MQTMTRDEKLRELAKCLRGAHKKALEFKGNVVDFNMDYYLKETSREGGFCETSACVLGHAALHKPFQEMGLRPILGSVVGVVGSHREYVITYQGKYYDRAGADFFDLTENEVNELFYGVFENPLQAAEWIEGNLL